MKRFGNPKTEIMNTPSFRLAECEAIITTGIKSFYEVGKALQEIRDKTLFHESGFQTFKEYCQKKWKWDTDYAYRLMQSAEIIKELEIQQANSPTIVGVLPSTETQARPLIKIKDLELRNKVWNEVVKESEDRNEPITAKCVEVHVNNYITNDTDKQQPHPFRVVTYLTPSYYKKFELQKRGEKEADYLRRMVEYCLDNNIKI